MTEQRRVIGEGRPSAGSPSHSPSASPARSPISLPARWAQLRTAAACMAVLCVPGLMPSAQAQSAAAYPAKPIRIIVPVQAGAPSDIIARMIGPKLTETWRQPVIAENRVGATGLLAAEAMYKAPADGHTMIVMTLTQLISTLVYQKYMLASEFAAVSLIGATPFAIAINPAVPAKNIAEFIAWAKARPGEPYASTGNWGSAHLCMESFNSLAGIKMLHVPHPGAPVAANALMAGDVKVYCAAALSVAKLAQGGRLRLLGVTYQQPTKLMPGLPPVSETLPGFELLGWYGVQASKGTPPDVVAKINAEIVRIVKQPEMGERMMATGVDPLGSTPAEFTSFLQKEADRWSRVLKEHNARPEDL